MVSMRLGVLDVGSDTVHLLVVDGLGGARPTPMTSEKTELRLAERMDAAGRLTDEVAHALVDTVGRAAAQATAAGCDEVLPFAISALRDATNCDAVTGRVWATTPPPRRRAGARSGADRDAALHVAQLEIWPWALREGVIFRRLDTLDGRLPDAPAAPPRHAHRPGICAGGGWITAPSGITLP